MEAAAWRRRETASSKVRLTRQLHNLLESGRIHALPGAYNALSARVFEQAGFECTYLGGSAITNTLLGLPDTEMITIDLLATITSYVTSVVSIPVVIDADTGFGNAINVAHTVHRLEKAGAAGLHIEDQVVPKRCGHIAGKEVIPIEEMQGKIRAAVEAREDPDFLIISRCDARAIEGPEGAIRRSNEYAEAGADATFVDGATSVQELERFAREIGSRYHVANMGGSAKKRTTPKVPLKELEAMGYELVVFGLQMVLASTRAMIDFARDLRERGIEADKTLLVQLEGYAIEDWYSYTGFDQVRLMEERYLPREALNKYATGPDSYYQPKRSS